MQAAFVDPSASLKGRIQVGNGASIWPFVSMRAEANCIEIGEFTNIQDFAMLHIGYTQDVRVGDYCSITHRATLHGCVVEDFCLIGIGAIIMDGCVIGRGSIVAGNSFLREGTHVPPNSIVMGTPGKVVAERDTAVDNVVNALLYHQNALAYSRGEHRAWEQIDHAGLQDQARSIVSLRQSAL